MGEIYETDDTYNLQEIVLFEAFVDDEIGVEYERNEADVGQYYLMVFDLDFKEVKLIRNYENSLRLN